MSLQPDPLDAVLSAVVAEGRRRRARRTKLLTGLGVVAVAVLVAGSTLALARTGGSKVPSVAAPLPSTSLAEPTTSSSEAPTTTSAAPPAPTTTIPGRRPKPTTPLVKVGAEAQFLSAVKAEALREVTPYGLQSVSGYGNVMMPMVMPAMAAPSAAPRSTAPASRDSASNSAPAAGEASGGSSGPGFSGTNNQEKGVDEADQVKTDGKRLFVVRDQKVEIIDVTSGSAQIVGSIELGQESASGLLLQGTRLLVFSSPGHPRMYGGPAGASPGMPGPAVTKVRTVDVAVPSKPKVVTTSEVDGAYVDARLIGGVARLVASSAPKLDLVMPTDGTPEAERAALTENKRRISASTVRAWLPTGASVSRAYRTQEASGLDVVTVRSVDPASGTVGAPVSVVSGAQVVYASLTSLYVATTEYSSTLALRQSRAIPAPQRTSVHKFDISNPAEAAYVGSGDVVGTVLNQFSLSEQGDALRIATTATTATTTLGSESAVTVFRPSAGALVEVGQVGGLGKGERIYAVRFMGDRGYVVTFRQVDPLYVIDLHEPTKPTVTGELKITGYSAYLHPVGDHQLIGIGQAASEEGRREGFQISLFDVKDPRNPRKISGATIPGGSSQVEHDHHAFLWWEPAGLALVPVSAYDPNGNTFVGVVGYGVGANKVDERGRISHPAPPDQGGGSYAPPIERSVVVGDRIFTISNSGVLATDLATLKPGGFARFG